MGLIETAMSALKSAMGSLGGSPDQNEPPSPQEKECRDFADKLYQQAQGTLTPLYRQWYTLILWVLGEHYLEFDNRLNRFIARPERAHIPREISNLILDYAERCVSYLGKSNATGHVVPEGVSSADYQRARTAEYIRKHLWDDDLMDLKLRVANSWCVYTGNAILLTGLDAVNKPVFQIPKMIPQLDPSTGVPMADENGEPMMVPDPSGEIETTVPLTEVSTDPVNPMEIVPDPFARNPWELRYWLHHRAVDRDVLADQYGSDIAKQVEPDKDLWTSYQYQHKLLDLVTRLSQAGYSYALTSAVADTRMENAVIVKTLYRMPCRNYPQGEILTYAGGKTLEYAPYPFVNPEGKAYRNLHWYGWSLAPGCLWRFGVVQNLTGPQKRLNGMLTQAALNRKTMGNAQWMAPTGSNFDDEATSKPGAVFWWTPGPKLRGARPERLPGVPMSPDFWREVEATIDHMDRISGFNDVLRGENPTGVTAGVSLDLLSERASGRFEPPIKEMRREIKVMEEFRLFLVSKSGAWANGKKLFVRDEDGIGETIELTNLDAPTDPTIEIEASSTLLWTQAAKKEGVMAMLNAGVIDLTLPENRRLLRDLFNADEFKDGPSADVILAEYENQQLVKGAPVATRPLENPTVHIPIHRRMTLRPGYKALPAAVRMNIEKHIAETMDRISQMAQQQQAATEPTPPPSPVAAPGAPPVPTDLGDRPDLGGPEGAIA